LPEHLETDHVEWLSNLLINLGPDVTSPLVEELRNWRLSRVDKAYLRSVGRIWDDSDFGDDLVEHPKLEKALNAIEAALSRHPPRSVLLIGELGVGKTAVIQKYARHLQKRGWVLFEAGHADLLAGQIYVGQFEERFSLRVRSMLANSKSA
jgi:signal recognition particle GTPase